jgi:hypothetical protein
MIHQSGQSAVTGGHVSPDPFEIAILKNTSENNKIIAAVITTIF